MKEMVMQMGSNDSTRSCHGPLPLDRLYHSKCELHQKTYLFYEKIKKESSLKHISVFESILNWYWRQKHW